MPEIINDDYASDNENDYSASTSVEDISSSTEFENEDENENDENENKTCHRYVRLLHICINKPEDLRNLLMSLNIEKIHICFSRENNDDEYEVYIDQVKCKNEDQFIYLDKNDENFENENMKFKFNKNIPSSHKNVTVLDSKIWERILNNYKTNIKEYKIKVDDFSFIDIYSNVVTKSTYMTVI